MNKKIILIISILLIFTIPAFAGEVSDENSFRETIYVTGNPATPSHIRKVITHYFERKNISISIPEDAKIPSLRPGDSVVINIQGQLTGNGDKEEKFSGTVPVLIKNEYVPIIPCEFLAFSNHPEKVTKRGLLYEAGLIRHKPVRLRYYHLTDKGADPHYIGFYLGNNTNKPARVHIVESYGGPSKNVMLAGHMNNLKFFHKKEKNLGWIEEIPANSIKLIRRKLSKPGEVISSTADLHLLTGGPLQVYVYASDKKDQDLSVELTSSKKDRHARGAYPLTEIRTEAVFSTEEDERFFTIADTPLSNIFAGKAIRGNYGVMYVYDFTLKNPYKEEKSVSFYLQPRGGIATATFSFDDRPVSVGFTRAYQLVRLCRVKIPGGKSRKITVKTMPEDASNYPIRLILMSE